MERAVFWIAIVVAAAIGLGALIEGPNIHFGHMSHFGDFGEEAEPVIETRAEQVGLRTFEAQSTSVKHAAVLVTVTAEDRTDIAVEIDNPGRLPTPEASLENGRLVIDGRLRGRVHDCGETIDVRGYGAFGEADLPRITLRTPRHVELRVSSAGRTEIGPAQSVDGDLSGCGDVTIGDVAEELKLDLSGAGDVNAGAAGSLDLDVAGASEARIGAVADGARISVAGSGEIEIALLTGALDGESAGSGGFTVRGGAVTEADIDLAGSGSALIAANVEKLTVSIVGSGEVDVDGEVGEIDADIAGSGGVRVNSVRGAVKQSVMGSGSIEIGP